MHHWIFYDVFRSNSQLMLNGASPTPFNIGIFYAFLLVIIIDFDSFLILFILGLYEKLYLNINNDNNKDVNCMIYGGLPTMDNLRFILNLLSLFNYNEISISFESFLLFELIQIALLLI